MSKIMKLPEGEKRIYKILLVDDDPSVLEVTYEILKDKGYQITTAISGEDALEVLGAGEFDMVITDLTMGQVNGIAVLKKAKKINPKIFVIIATGNAPSTFALEALRYSADDYILKPFRLSDLVDRVSRCLEKGTPLNVNYA